jgi:cytochrome c biogenesis factor
LTLLIAQNLQWDGDSLEMLRAVLDTNIWLATHVVVVTLGYSATFLSGFLGIVYIARGLLTKSFDQETSKSLARMIYGVVCFATLFSFTGTILGGIWADQSWGRFWGWDPKENGALLIVLWNAIILHARWGGYARERGVAALAVFGNIVTSLSWFGVNMLGVGLHSYGFMDHAFGPLMLFIISQLLIVAAAMIPLKYWRGIRAREEKAPVTVDADLLYNR